MRRAGNQTSGVADDIETQLETWASTKTAMYASEAYDALQAAVFKILDDASTQIRIGEAQDHLFRSLALTTVATSLLTWGMLKYVGTK